MLQITIPGMGELKLTDLMLDYNGTLALDGYLINDVTKRLAELSSQFKIHVVTGDTHGTAKNQLANINCQLTIVPPENQATAKLDYLKQLGQSNTIAIGNGKNDQYILKESVVGIVVLGNEGIAIEALNAADILVPTIFDAINLLQYPNRLRSTLRT